MYSIGNFAKDTKNTEYYSLRTLCCAELFLVAQSCLTLWTPWIAARQAPLSLGILWARILEGVTMPSSRGSSQARDWTQVSHTAGRFFTDWATREALSTLQGEFLFYFVVVPNVLYLFTIWILTATILLCMFIFFFLIDMEIEAQRS